MEVNKVIQGDCLIKLKELEDNSVDSIITDPPYELGFMGKSWDNTGIANNKEMWAECLRVLKPGGHLLSFSGTRTYHRMACAIEDAGFEVRDMVEWVYGSGMSKCNVWGKGKVRTSKSLNAENDLMVENGWEGWGKGGLKPAHEPICMARKPLDRWWKIKDDGKKVMGKVMTVAENCLKWGTGGINIDESRVEVSKDDPNHREIANKTTLGTTFGSNEEIKSVSTGKSQLGELGRFPANLIHDNSEEVRECFPESNGRFGAVNTGNVKFSPADYGKGQKDTGGIKDSGNASRFFKSILYYPKASKSERNKGCEGLDKKPKIFNGQSDKPSTDMKDVEKRFTTLPKANNHPTVKPIALMEYLIKMVTPKGGIVLDPFAGSGSTLVAAKQNGFQYIGIELTEEYIPIIEARLNAVRQGILI